MTRCEEVAKGYIPSIEMQGLQIAQLLEVWPEIEGGASQPIWESLARGKNYYLNTRLDDDSFYSLTTISSYKKTLIGTEWMQKYATASRSLNTG
jgi:hypothetical protein